MAQPPHWAEVLSLRPEVSSVAGEVANLQMSLYDVWSQTADVPYRDIGYYDAITLPTPGLVGFMGQVAQRLGSDSATRALFHLDQGMGGGKSHAMVGMYHLGKDPAAFLATELGQQVRREAEERANGPIDPTDTHVVVLAADTMSPGVTRPEFGPATNLHERFIWSLFPGDFDRYHRLVASGSDRAALRAALREVGRPVLILLDELMVYAERLSDKKHRDTLPGEQAFLASLMDAVDEVPRVAFVVVMIKSEDDDRGYQPEANEFRDYITRRLHRSGTTAAVTDVQDFAAIIRRRIFERPTQRLPTKPLAAAWTTADEAWTSNVFDTKKLPSTRGLVGLEPRLEATYPFHPDLMALVRDDWSKHAGFQRVRSTVDIFAATAFYWASQYKDGRYAPPLIGVGDLPLHRVIESVLSSGLLHGNDRAQQGFRAVAAGDVITKDHTKGRAVELDAQFASTHPSLSAEEQPCVRLATALLLYSVVARAQARRGATKAELLAALYRPGGLDYTTAEEAFTLLIDIDEGLGALQIIPGRGGNQPTRYQLTISQTLQMYYRQAKSMVAEDAQRRDTYIWERVKAITNQGPFDRPVFVKSPDPDTSLETAFAEVDEQTSNRLVILDPRRWSLANGKDAQTAEEVTALLGLGDRGLRVDNAASVVVACINTQKREQVRRRAMEALAYQTVGELLEPDDELREEAKTRFKDTERQLSDDLKRAYQHIAYLTRPRSGTVVEWRRFDQEDETALAGRTVWDKLVGYSRAVGPGKLDGVYLTALLDVTERNFTLREIVRRFWQDPKFPLVSSLDDVREAIYDAVENRHLWEIVDGDGAVLTVESPGKLAINSSEHMVRKATPPAPPPATPTTQPDGSQPTSSPATGAAASNTGAGGGEGQDSPQAEPTYARFTIKLPSKSVVQSDPRQKISNLFSQVADDLDPTSGVDIQLVEFTLRLTAADDSLSNLQQKADAIDAQWAQEADEFDF